VNYSRRLNLWLRSDVQTAKTFKQIADALADAHGQGNRTSWLDRPSKNLAAHGKLRDFGATL